jgi:hypothetical protein
MEIKDVRPGVQVITFSKEDMDKIDSKLATDNGMTLEEYRKALKEDQEKHWCKGKCETNGRSEVFHDDGRRTNQHCPRKHHYHCPKCKKLTQIG